MDKKTQISGSSISELDSNINKLQCQRNKLILKLILHTGIYPEELVNLRKEHFDLENGYINIISEIARTQPRVILLPNELAQELSEFEAGQHYFFRTKQSPKLTKRAVQRIFEEFSQHFGKKFVSKDFRKLCINRSLRNSSRKYAKHLSGLKRLTIK